MYICIYSHINPGIGLFFSSKQPLFWEKHRIFLKIHRTFSEKHWTFLTCFFDGKIDGKGAKNDHDNKNRTII